MTEEEDGAPTGPALAAMAAVTSSSTEGERGSARAEGVSAGGPASPSTAAAAGKGAVQPVIGGGGVG